MQYTTPKQNSRSHIHPSSYFVLYQLYQYETYILLADGVKCFDELRLQDACKELFKVGVPAKEAELILKWNEAAVVKVDTHLGLNKETTLGNIVRQGTIMGTVLCTIATDISIKLETTVLHQLDQISKGLLLMSHTLMKLRLVESLKP